VGYKRQVVEIIQDEKGYYTIVEEK